MYALVFIFLLIILASMAFLTHMENSSVRTSRHATTNVVRIAAQQGAQVISACGKESPGVYSIANLISAGYLPNGYAPSTPLGPQWTCQVSSGGANGQNVIILTVNGPFTNIPGLGSLAAKQDTLQSNVSWNLAQDISPQVAGMSNVVVGILPVNSTTMTSVIDGQQYNLSGLVNAQSYTLPIIAENVVASTP